MPGEENIGFVVGSSEREALAGFLDRQREALIRKIQGLDDATARKAPTASALSLLGIVKHGALWERRWFQVIAAGRRFPGEWPEGDYTGMGEDFVVDENDTLRRPRGTPVTRTSSARPSTAPAECEAWSAWSDRYRTFV
jgi:hypothetical protein